MAVAVYGNQGARPGATFKRSYGAGQSMSVPYVTKVPYVYEGNAISGPKALRLALESAYIPKFLEQPDPDVPLYAVDHEVRLTHRAQIGYICEVTVQFLAAHLVESGFVFHYSTNVQTSRTMHDLAGQVIKVPYKKAGATETRYQTGEVECLQPTGQVTAYGIVSTNEPVKLIQAWLNTINSDVFAGCGAGTLLCCGVDLDPWSLETVPGPQQWKARFTWLMGAVSSNGYPWAKIAYWQEDDGKPPADAVLGNGWISVDVAPSVRYGGLYPFDRG